MAQKHGNFSRERPARGHSSVGGAARPSGRTCSTLCSREGREGGAGTAQGRQWPCLAVLVRSLLPPVHADRFEPLRGCSAAQSPAWLGSPFPHRVDTHHFKQADLLSGQIQFVRVAPGGLDAISQFGKTACLAEQAPLLLGSAVGVGPRAQVQRVERLARFGPPAQLPEAVP
jgi:hypothetical protein